MGVRTEVQRVGLIAALVTGCASWLPAPVPMRTLSDRAHPTKRSRCLLVLMPGIGDSDKDFVDHGFIAAVRQRGIPIDIISANATLGYYGKRTLHARIETDILAPARRAGYEKIWFGGISMGGLGSLLVARQHGRALAGVILIAPYLGDTDLITEISSAGGLPRWQPAASITKDDYQRDVWRWLKGATEKPDSAPPLYLLTGDQDRLFRSHRLLGAVLPPQRRFRTRGKHDWVPWLVLWKDFLDRSDFRAQCTEP